MKFFLSIFALILLTGCLENDQPEKNAQPQIPEQTQHSTKPHTHDDEIEKWNLYVDLGNYLTSDFTPAMDEYFSKFGPGTDYLPKERDQYMADFLSRLVEDDNLSKEIELALAKAAHLDSDLDLATYEMGIQLKEVWSELIKARDYYAGGKFESDEYADAQEVHARIYDAYMSLSATNTRFWDILTKEDAERRKKDIQELKNQGFPLRAAMLDVIDKGQALQDLLNQLSITFGSLSSLDSERFLPLYEEFNTSLTTFEGELAKTNGKSKPEGIKESSLAEFSNQLKETKASAADLIELRRLKGKLDETPENISGTPEHFGKELSLLVDSYNSLAPEK